MVISQTMTILLEEKLIEVMEMFKKLISKYNDLAREALSNGDKILSENYFQYADHFLRVSLEQKEKDVS